MAAYLSAGVTVWSRLQLALLLPAYLRNDGGEADGYDVGGVVAGDPGVDLRLTLLDRRAPIELALAATLRAPVGASNAFSSDGAVSAWPRAVASVAFGTRSFVSFAGGPTGSGPNRSHTGVASGGKMTTQPWPYAVPPPVGATTS